LKQLLDILADRDAHGDGGKSPARMRALGGKNEPHGTQLIDENRCLLLFDHKRVLSDRVPCACCPVENSKGTEERLARKVLFKSLGLELARTQHLLPRTAGDDQSQRDALRMVA
jgi:hypothetical protein